jgi:hypothetical protein
MLICLLARRHRGVLYRRFGDGRFILGTHGRDQQNQNNRQNDAAHNHDHLRALPTTRQWFLSRATDRDVGLNGIANFKEPTAVSNSLSG